MSSGQTLVERKLVLRDAGTGERKPITIKIGLPYWADEDVEGACAVEIDGLLGRREEIRGIDPLNALELAIAFANTFLSGREVFWPDGESYP